MLALCTGGDSCRREHRDLDLVAPRSSSKRLLGTLARLGFEENRHVRLASGGALLQVYRPCRHPGSRGPLHVDDRVDVYLDAFRLHHTIVLRRRLPREPYTLPPSDVLLAKLLRTRMSETDVGDVAAVLRDVDIREDEAAGSDRAAVPGSRGARGTGVCTTTSPATSGAWRAEAGALGLGVGEAQRVERAAARVLAAMDAARKGPRWRLRALIGERLPWYDAVDEDDGQRIGLRERPAGAAGPVTRHERAA